MTNDDRIQAVKDILSELNLTLSAPIAVDYADGEKYIIFLKVTINKDGNRIPGRLQIKSLLDSLDRINYSASIVMVEGDNRNIDATIKSFLFTKFESEVRNSFSVENDDVINIWVDPKSYLDDHRYKIIDEAIRSFITSITKKNIEIFFTKKQNTPTVTVILRVVRIGAPMDLSSITSALLDRGYDVPNDVWLKHALDRLRKSSLIGWRKPGLYYLTLGGLNSLGTEKNRRSPDIQRALVLARRGS